MGFPSHGVSFQSYFGGSQSYCEDFHLYDTSPVSLSSIALHGGLSGSGGSGVVFGDLVGALDIKDREPRVDSVLGLEVTSNENVRQESGLNSGAVGSSFLCRFRAFLPTGLPGVRRNAGGVDDLIDGGRGVEFEGSNSISMSSLVPLLSIFLCISSGPGDAADSSSVLSSSLDSISMQSPVRFPGVFICTGSGSKGATSSSAIPADSLQLVFRG